MGNHRLIQGTIFGNLKIPKLGVVKIKYLDLSVESREINELGTTVFPGNKDKIPFRITIFGKEYNLEELPTTIELGNGTSTTLHQFDFPQSNSTIILFGLPEIPEALQAK